MVLRGSDTFEERRRETKTGRKKERVGQTESERDIEKNRDRQRERIL
jgi:hypothetical protein